MICFTKVLPFLRKLDSTFVFSFSLGGVNSSIIQKRNSSNIKGPIIGIDLGTKYCTAAIMDGRTPIMLYGPNSLQLPVIVKYYENGTSVGDDKLSYEKSYEDKPKEIIHDIKKIIGRKFTDPQVHKHMREVHYKIVEAHNGDAWIEIDRNLYSPSEIFAHLLDVIRERAMNHFYCTIPVDDAVMTFPLDFNCHQIQATKKVAELAGLNVVGLISETEAVALAYGLHEKEDHFAAVCEFGHCALRVSILEIVSGAIKVKSTSYDTELGTPCFTNVIFEYLKKNYMKKILIDPGKHDYILTFLNSEAEKCLKSTSSLYPYSVDCAYPDFHSFTRTEPSKMFLTSLKYEFTKLGQKKSEILFSNLKQKIVAICKNAIQKAGIDKKDIKKVVLSGRVTGSYLIRPIIKEAFHQCPVPAPSSISPVAIGAAIQGGILSEYSRFFDEGSWNLFVKEREQLGEYFSFSGRTVFFQQGVCQDDSDVKFPNRFSERCLVAPETL